MKTCPKCSSIREDSIRDCKVCKSVMDKAYQAAHREEIKAKRHQYYLANKDKIVGKVNAYIEQNRDKHNAWGTIAKNKLKTEVLTHYSDGLLKCKNCPECDLAILTIDHINGDDAKHRREIGLYRRGGYPVYQWLKRNGYPEGFQTLCFNCQFRKRAVEMKPENPTHLQLVRAKYARSIKIECLEAYGDSQCKCGEKDLEVLSLDHVNDDGAEHRRETNTRGHNFYHMLRKNGFPKEPQLQVICMNCQFKKRSYSKESIYESENT